MHHLTPCGIGTYDDALPWRVQAPSPPAGGTPLAEKERPVQAIPLVSHGGGGQVSRKCKTLPPAPRGPRANVVPMTRQGSQAPPGG